MVGPPHSVWDSLAKHPTPPATGFPGTSSYYRHDETKDNGRTLNLHEVRKLQTLAGFDRFVFPVAQNRGSHYDADMIKAETRPLWTGRSRHWRQHHKSLFSSEMIDPFRL
jgi:hypothetical protein